MIRGTVLRTLCLLLVLVMACPLLGGQVSSDENPAIDNTMTYNLYFGDLHTHTVYSDAWEGTPWDAYAMAIEGGADFMATTDHFSFHHAYVMHCVDSEEWQDTLDAAAFYTSDTFVAMPAYEYLMTANGEVNVYNVPVLPPVLDAPGYRYDRLPIFYDWLSQQDGAIGQWNHPLYFSDDFMDYAYYSEERDIAMNVIEAYNGVIYQESYIKALDKGWHVMPSSNSDTHDPDWIVGHEMRSVLLAPVLDAEHLYEAMRECRGYATLDKNLEIYYTLNGAVMGSNLSDPAVTTYTASIQIEDPDGQGDEITLVEIISNGGEVVDWEETSGTSVDLTFDLTSNDAGYFFVRVTTVSPLNGDVEGVTAWTAPVWTGR